MLGAAVTVTLAVEVLLARFESRVSEATVAVLATVPDELGAVTTSVIVVGEPPTAMVPREQLTVLVPEHTAGSVPETVVPFGRMSPTITFTAGLGPALATVRV
jgi:hypothetical protein